ncbi:MAG: hypothetical protein ACPGU7_02800 [Gammaproteobacteria bacterium]
MIEQRRIFSARLAMLLLILPLQTLGPAQAWGASHGGGQASPTATGAAMADAPVFLIPATDWLRPRSALGVSANRAIRDAVRRWLDTPGGRMVIRYPGGDQGTLWARELRDWLTTLGVASEHIDLVPGGPAGDGMAIEVHKSF